MRLERMASARLAGRGSAWNIWPSWIFCVPVPWQLAAAPRSWLYLALLRLLFIWNNCHDRLDGLLVPGRYKYPFNKTFDCKIEIQTVSFASYFCTVCRCHWLEWLFGYRNYGNYLHQWRRKKDLCQWTCIGILPTAYTVSKLRNRFVWHLI